MTEVELTVIANRFDDDPLRLRQGLAEATIGEHNVEISMCASGAHLYVRGNGKQVAFPLRNLVGALPELGIELEDDDADREDE